MSLSFQEAKGDCVCDYSNLVEEESQKLGGLGAERISSSAENPFKAQ